MAVWSSANGGRLLLLEDPRRWPFPYQPAADCSAHRRGSKQFHLVCLHLSESLHRAENTSAVAAHCSPLYILPRNGLPERPRKFRKPKQTFLHSLRHNEC